MAVMVREAWTDERLDQGFREVRAEMRELRTEIGQVREGLGELRAEIKGLEKKFDARFGALDAKFEAKFVGLDARLEAMNRTMQIGFGLIGAVLTGILGLIAT